MRSADGFRDAAVWRLARACRFGALTIDGPSTVERCAAALLAFLAGSGAVVAADPEANLSIAYTRSAGPVRTQDQVTYSVRVANAGPASATSIKVVATLPQGSAFSSAGGIDWDCGDPVSGVVTCTLPSLAVGVKAPLLGIAVTPSSRGGTLRATATVSGAEADPSTADNTASESVVVDPAPR